MKMFDTTQHLIKKIGHSFMVQLHLNHLAEICIHEFHHYVAYKEKKKNNQIILPFYCILSLNHLFIK